VLGQQGRLIAGVGHGLEARDRRIGVGVPADIDEHHAADLEELNLGRPPLGERRIIDDFGRALGIGPVEHLDPVVKGLLGGHRGRTPSQKPD